MTSVTMKGGRGRDRILNNSRIIILMRQGDYGRVR